MRQYNVYDAKMARVNLRVYANNAKDAIRIAKEHSVRHPAVVEVDSRGNEIDEALDKGYWAQTYA